MPSSFLPSLFHPHGTKQVEEEAKGVYHCLNVFQNMVEVDPQLADAIMGTQVSRKEACVRLVCTL